MKLSVMSLHWNFAGTAPLASDLVMMTECDVDMVLSYNERYKSRYAPAWS